MGKFLDLFKRNTTNDRLKTEAGGIPVIQEHDTRLRVNPLCSNYENLFAQLRPLIDAMKTVRPFGVDASGKKLPLAKTPELALLNSPNQQMGWVDFADLAFATWLSEPELNIHVWRGREGAVTGYTILPARARQPGARRDGADLFIFNDRAGQVELTEAEVMTLRYSRSPHNPDLGISPATSVTTWAQIDDILGQYQRAFLENGATPASVTFITASTRDRYESERAKLERGLHGARNKNKTVYVWRQMLANGETKDGVEVKTIQGNNDTLALKEIADIINDKLNKSVGVSNFIMGDDASAKYDNAELSDHQFTRRRVYPALISFWGTFQHELDRIVGGLGYGIDFQLDVPDLTAQAHAKALVADQTAKTLTDLIQNGVGATAAVEALGLGDRWYAVALGLKREKERLASSQELQTVLPKKAEPPVTLKSGDAVKKAEPKKAVGAIPEVGDPVPKIDLAEKKMKGLLVKMARAIILEEHPEVASAAAVELAIGKIINQLAGLGYDAGAENFAEEVEPAVRSAVETAFEKGEWKLSEGVKVGLEERVGLVAAEYGATCAEALQKAKAVGAEKGLSVTELKRELQKSIPKDVAETIARTETNHAFRVGKMDSLSRMAKTYGVEMEIEWVARHDEITCSVCAAMDGETVKLGEAFPDHVERDGTDYFFEKSDWNENGVEPNAHPRCRCTFKARRVKT